MTAELAETTTPLAELAESWLLALEAEGKSAATLKAYRQGAQGFITSCPVPVLESKTVTAYLAGLRRAGQKPGTVRLRYSTLRLLAKWLAAEGELPADPLASMKPPAPGKASVDALSDAELTALVKACKGTGTFADRRDVALALVLATGGLRAGEACALTLADVDLRERVITVRRGKGGKPRSVPIPPVTALAVDRWLRARRAHPLADTPALWLGVQGRTFGYEGLAQALGTRARAAGIEGFHAHRLRHGFASRWLAAGGSEDGLMAVCGWSDHSMLRRYTATDRSQRAIAESKRLNLF